MKDLGLAMATDSPRLSPTAFRFLMVKETDLLPCMFRELSGRYPLGIGAGFAGDCGGFSGGIALEHQEGFALAIKHTPCHPIVGKRPPPVNNFFEGFREWVRHDSRDPCASGL